MKRIILVEDDEPIRDIFHIVFPADNFEIVDLENGEPIMTGQIGAPDLFVLDKSISGTNGLDLCRFIKADEKLKNVPVIMLSACPDLKALAKEAGADDAIAKPFSLNKMRETVSGLLQS